MSYQPTPSKVGALRLHYNENTAGCSPAVLQALRSIRREDVGLYPESIEINARVERWLGVEAGSVQVTNGLDEGIQAVGQYGARHYGDSRAATPEVIIVEPAFEVYEACADALGAGLVRIPPEPDFRFPLERLLASITPETRVVYLTDPNNPTGLGIPPGAVETILAAAPQALVLVDEAYADFSGRTLIGLVDRCRNLVVGRTFAKAYGLAGLRIGAIVAHRDTISQLRRVILPFNVNCFAITALSAALADRAYLDWYVGEVAASREAIYAFCRERGLKYWLSEANFVLFHIGNEAGRLTAALAERDILVRDKSASPGCAGCIRLTAGVLDHTRRALSALEEILATSTR